jgi:deoxyribodipyrimidine photo-lyase
MKLDKMLSASESPSSTPTRSRSPTSSNLESPAKKARIVSETTSDDNAFPIFKQKTVNSTSQIQVGSLVEEIKNKRLNQCESIQAFRFNKKRVRVLSEATEISEESQGILYWMSREQRVQDNWSLLYAQKLALKQNLPLHVCFCLVPTHLNATFRHYYFMLEGLKEVEKELGELNIPFHLLIGFAKDQVPKFVEENSMGAVICDFSPLKVSLNWVEDLKKNLPPTVPFAQVDGHNVVPVWVASDKLEYSARTIRNKINSKLGNLIRFNLNVIFKSNEYLKYKNLDDFLTEFPPVVKQKLESKIKAEQIDWDKCYESLDCDRKVKVVEWYYFKIIYEVIFL